MILERFLGTTTLNGWLETLRGKSPGGPSETGIREPEPMTLAERDEADRRYEDNS